MLIFCLLDMCKSKMDKTNHIGSESLTRLYRSGVAPMR